MSAWPIHSCTRRISALAIVRVPNVCLLCGVPHKRHTHATLGSLAEPAVRTRSSCSSGGESLLGGVTVKNCFDVVDCSVEVWEVRHWIGSGGEGGRQYSVVGLGEHD